jgi:GT2 family glycosyltransferase
MQVAPRVSVIIVTLDEADLTLNCVESVIQNTKTWPYEIIVVDNGSAPNEVQKLVEASNGVFSLISLNRNLFFGEANNIAAEQASGDYIVFLNNDVRVTSGWLDQLVTTFEIETFAGAVGPKFLYPNGKLQEAGAYIRGDGWTLQMGKHVVNLPSAYIDSTQIVDYSSAACLLLKRQTFLNLGGFDPIFDPAYFEDVDLALRLRSIGLFSYFCGQVAVYHEENRTSRRLWSDEQIQGHLAANHARFYGRWGDYLRRRLSEDCEPDPLPQLEYRPGIPINKSQTAVLFCPSPLRPSENSRRLLLAASALEESYSVVIAAEEIFSRCRVYSLCREFNIQLTSFQIRNISQIEACESQLIVAFDGAPSSGRLGTYIRFECDGRTLLQHIEDLR